MNDITRRKFLQSHGLMALIIAYICGIEVEAEETYNYSFNVDRTRLNDDRGKLEKAIAEQWAEANKAIYDHGILQMLMLQAARKEGPDFDPWISDRERKIVAMIIQWLGTNVGSSFLYAASKRAGPRFECYPFHNQNFKG